MTKEQKIKIDTLEKAHKRLMVMAAAHTARKQDSGIRLAADAIRDMITEVRDEGSK